MCSKSGHSGIAQFAPAKSVIDVRKERLSGTKEGLPACSRCGIKGH
jgi:hypothetical protein